MGEAPFRDREKAREAGRRGGRASGKARQKLTLQRAENELPAMDSPETIVRRLEILATWAAAGLISGTVAHALTRGAEVALKAHESKLTREVVDGLRKRLAELEAQVKRPQIGALR